MTKPDEVVLRDISGRLAYGVLCVFYDYEKGIRHIAKLVSIHVTRFKGWNTDTVDITGQGIGGDDTRYVYNISGVKPILRPLSKMTKEEKEELAEIYDSGDEGDLIDFYNSHGLDYRNLINRGLAIEETPDRRL